jgi:hypothetical protein
MSATTAAAAAFNACLQSANPRRWLALAVLLLAVAID